MSTFALPPPVREWTVEDTEVYEAVVALRRVDPEHRADVKEAFVAYYGESFERAMRSLIQRLARGAAFCPACDALVDLDDLPTHPCALNARLDVALRLAEALVAEIPPPHDTNDTNPKDQPMSLAETVIPQTPSNKSVVNMAQAWGCKVGKRKPNNQVELLLPDGKSKHLVMRPDYHDGNSAATIVGLAEALGLTLEQFWAGPPTVEPVREPDTDVEPGQRGYIVNMVLDILVGQRGPMSLQKIAQMTGLPETQVGPACRALVNQGAAVRVKRGVYQAAAQERSIVEHRGPVQHQLNGNGTITAAPEPAPEPAPAPPAPAPAPEPAPTPPPAPAPKPVAQVATVPHRTPEEVEEVIEVVLDAIAPNGFHYRHLRAIDDFRDSVRNLIQALEG